MNEVLDKVDNDLMLRVAQFKDLDDIYNLYVERVDWFRHKDIGQWKYYLDFHPKEEFYDIIKNKRLYVVIKDYEIVGAVEIKYINKEFWNDEKNNTVYIKKLVTKIGVKDIVIQEKTLFGWRDINVDKQYINNSDVFSGGVVLYSAEKGKTYRAHGTHYAIINGREYTLYAESSELTYN